MYPARALSRKKSLPFLLQMISRMPSARPLRWEEMRIHRLASREGLPRLITREYPVNSRKKRLIVYHRNSSPSSIAFSGKNWGKN
jgi:hypothetical protein